MERIAIVANCLREAAVVCGGSLTSFLTEQGVEVRLEADLASALRRPDLLGSADMLGRSRFVVACGGDGTLLAANRIAVVHRTPVLGVHVGGPASFGFMMETTPHNAESVLADALAGRCRVEERLMAAATVMRAGTSVAAVRALNDLVLRAESRMIKMRVEIGGHYIATYAADGIIVATPTGSTAYNLAAGGPLVHPSIQALLLTPICPHTLNVRSLLVGPDEEIRVRLETGARDTTLLTGDGQESLRLEPHDEVLFRRFAEPARFLTRDVGNFYRKVHTRLRFGERFGA